jgi:hypothetical protein
MGVVYEATQLTLNRTVALKLLAAHLTDDLGFRERFRREGQIQAAIDHPNIITVHEAGESEHGLFIAMKLVRGPNLKDMIIGRELDAGRTLRILRPVADALNDAHDAGLTHRDIKPQNILVGARDHPFLADFGLTKGAGEKSLTRTGQFVGTIDYISPEQIQGERATAKSDIYALAGVMYECLTGVVPFPKESEAAVLYAHIADPRPRVSDERPELPTGLDDVILRGMAQDPEERYQSATDLLEDAERTFTRRMRAAITPPGPIGVPQETGIREAEANVETREAPAPKAKPVTPAKAEPVVSAGPTAEEIDFAEETRPAARVTDETRPATVKGTPQGPPPVAAPARAAPAPPAPARPAARPRPRPGITPALLAVAGGALLVTILAGFLIGHSGGGSDNGSAPANTASAGSLEVGFSSAWKRERQHLAIPGLGFRAPISLAPANPSGGRALTTGQTDGSGPSLLPASFVRRLPGGRPPPRTDRVKLGDLEAYRYKNLNPSGFGRHLTLYVSPTTAGIATVACAADASALASFAPDCEHVATTLKLSSGKPYPLGPDPSYAKAIDKDIGKLNSQVSSGKGRLRKAKTGAKQAKDARSLADAYATTAQKLGKLAVSPATVDVHHSVIRALNRTASAYRAMAAAAGRGVRGSYNSARRAVQRGENAVMLSLARLRQFGYRVR